VSLRTPFVGGYPSLLVSLRTLGWVSLSLSVSQDPKVVYTPPCMPVGGIYTLWYARRWGIYTLWYARRWVGIPPGMPVGG